VFIEPADPDEGHDQSASIIQLDVSTKSYVREEPTSGPSAVERSKLPCMLPIRIAHVRSTHQLCTVGAVLWSVSKSALDPLVIRDNLAAVRKRAFSPLFLPKGVKWEKMEEFWNGLQFNPTAPVDIPFNFELFRSPPKSVQVLRELAGRGRNYLERTISKQEGRPKLVLGLPNDAQDVAPLLALAHGPCLVPSVNSSDSATVDNESPGLENVQESDVGATNAVCESKKLPRKPWLPVRWSHTTQQDPSSLTLANSQVASQIRPQGLISCNWQYQGLTPTATKIPYRRQQLSIWRKCCWRTKGESWKVRTARQDRQAGLSRGGRPPPLPVLGPRSTANRKK
jgi:hypothetical protein